MVKHMVQWVSCIGQIYVINNIMMQYIRKGYVINLSLNYWILSLVKLMLFKGNTKIIHHWLCLLKTIVNFRWGKLSSKISILLICSVNPDYRSMSRCVTSQIARFMGPKLAPPGSCWPQMGSLWPHEHCYQGWPAWRVDVGNTHTHIND